MVDWVAGMADASVSERDSGSVLVRVPGSPDVLKEAPVSGFVTKDAAGNVAPLAGGAFNLGDGSTGAVQTLKGSSAGTAVVGNIVGSPTWLFGDTVTALGSGGGVITFVYGANPWLLYINGSERLKSDAVGNLTPGGDNTQALGSASKRWSVVYAGTGTINTSDERSKTDIGEIPDAWLDAWAGVEWRRYKFIDGNRCHIGLVAQQVHAAFAAHDLDAFQIGLCCFDAWDEEREPIFKTVTKTRKAKRTEQVPAGEDENGEVLYKLVEVAFDEEYEESIDTGKTRITLEAGDRWGLRYDECQAMEAAWHRRELSRMAERLAALENAN